MGKYQKLAVTRQMMIIQQEKEAGRVELARKEKMNRKNTEAIRNTRSISQQEDNLQMTDATDMRNMRGLTTDKDSQDQGGKKKIPDCQNRITGRIKQISDMTKLNTETEIETGTIKHNTQLIRGRKKKGRQGSNMLLDD